MMSRLTSIEGVLNPKFISPQKNRLLEQQPNCSMEVLIQGDEIPYLSYKYDKALRGYRGGLFPFLSQNEGVQKISDYILFAERGNRIYVLMIELKRGRSDTLKQLNAARCLAEYIVKTTIRVEGVSIEPHFRCISISEYKRTKKNTKEKPVQYDNEHTVFKGKTLRLRAFLT